MTVRKLHTILGYWDLVLLSIHLGFHYNLIFGKLKNKIKDKKVLKYIIYILEIVIVLLGIKVIFDINLGLYLIGKSSFSNSTNIISSIFNNFMVVLCISTIVYNFEK